MKKISGKIILYDEKVFDNEEELINYIREERLNYVLNDTECNLSEKKIQIYNIPEYDNTLPPTANDNLEKVDDQTIKQIFNGIKI